MSKNLLQMMGLSLIVAVVATCTDQTPTANDDVEASSPRHGSVTLACDLNHATKIPSDVKNFFKVNSVRNAAGKLAKELGDACASNNQPLATTRALTLLDMMEKELSKPNATGLALYGASLTRSLLACTTEVGCTSDAFAPFSIPGQSTLEKAFGETGMFAIRSGQTDDRSVIARTPFTFTDDMGRSDNKALFGAQVATNWADANTTPFVFFYGYRIDPTFVGEEVVANNVGYSFNRWPDPGKFKTDGLVHVGACFAYDVGFAHGSAPDPLGRIQRNETMLSYKQPTFLGCREPDADSPYLDPNPTLGASLWGSAKNFALSVLPRAWSAMFFGDVRTPVIGGSAWDFSDFAPAGANTAGRLVIEAAPAAGSFIKVGDALNIRVLALSGGDTPMERVPVEIYVAGNQGSSAGALVYADPNDKDPEDGDGTWGYTAEDDGKVTLTGHVGKPGGYTICARLKPSKPFPGFTFAESCTDQFQVVW